LGAVYVLQYVKKFFEMKDDGKSHVKAQKKIPCVKEAVEACPVEAISM